VGPTATTYGAEQATKSGQTGWWIFLDGIIDSPDVVLDELRLLSQEQHNALCFIIWIDCLHTQPEIQNWFGIKLLSELENGFSRERKRFKFWKVARSTPLVELRSSSLMRCIATSSESLQLSWYFIFRQLSGSRSRPSSEMGYLMNADDSSSEN